MTETTIIKLLKNQQLSKKALVEKVEAFTKEEQSELDALLTHLQACTTTSTSCFRIRRFS